MLGLKPIKTLPIREKIAANLREAILSKKIPAGEVLTLESTAQELGVSITPTREAFQILARDGLLELERNKKAVVLGVNEKTIREHFQIRAALESEACVLCCRKKIDLQRIDQILKVSREVIEEGDFESYSSLNQTLHMELWTAAGNDKLKNMLSELWNGLSRGVLVNEEEYVRKSLKEHQAIIECIRKGDAIECYLRMQEHIENSCENFVQRYQ
ncbi:GntR family transcriptional regulator [Blautia sp.]